MIPRHVYIFFPVSQQFFLRQSQIVPNTSPIKIISLIAKALCITDYQFISQ